jgi:hypothetical protein
MESGASRSAGSVRGNELLSEVMRHLSAAPESKTTVSANLALTGGSRDNAKLLCRF